MPVAVLSTQIPYVPAVYAHGAQRAEVCVCSVSLGNLLPKFKPPRKFINNGHLKAFAIMLRGSVAVGRIGASFSVYNACTKGRSEYAEIADPPRGCIRFVG